MSFSLTCANCCHIDVQSGILPLYDSFPCQRGSLRFLVLLSLGFYSSVSSCWISLKDHNCWIAVMRGCAVEKYPHPEPVSTIIRWRLNSPDLWHCNYKMLFEILIPSKSRLEYISFILTGVGVRTVRLLTLVLPPVSADLPIVARSLPMIELQNSITLGVGRSFTLWLLWGEVASSQNPHFGALFHYCVLTLLNCKDAFAVLLYSILDNVVQCVYLRHCMVRYSATEWIDLFHDKISAYGSHMPAINSRMELCQSILRWSLVRTLLCMHGAMDRERHKHLLPQCYQIMSEFCTSQFVPSFLFHMS